MAQAFNTFAIPIGIGIILFGLGMSLTLADFSRIVKHPKATLIALGCQLLLLPLIAMGVVAVFALPPVLAVGLLLLAASPGGATANLFSFVFGGNVVLNVSLTAVNSVVSAITLPLVTNFALAFYMSGDAAVGLQLAKVVEIFLLVVGPVVLGMLFRRLWPRVADASERVVRIASIVVLAILIAGVVFFSWDAFRASFGQLAGATAVFSLVSFGVGFAIPWLFGVRGRDSISSAYEVGIHNLAISIYVATVVLQNPVMALPSAVYIIPMNLVALLFGFTVARAVSRRVTKAELTSPTLGTATTQSSRRS